MQRPQPYLPSTRAPHAQLIGLAPLLGLPVGNYLNNVTNVTTMMALEDCGFYEGGLNATADVYKVCSQVCEAIYIACCFSNAVTHHLRLWPAPTTSSSTWSTPVALSWMCPQRSLFPCQAATTRCQA